MEGAALGDYDDRIEFQFDTTIVNFMCPRDGRKQSLSVAETMFDPAWQAIPCVLDVARRRSRLLFRSFWLEHDRARTADRQMAVHGMWLDPSTGQTSYYVGQNFEFTCPPNLPVFPHDHAVMVERSADGDLWIDNCVDEK